MAKWKILVEDGPAKKKQWCVNATNVITSIAGMLTFRCAIIIFFISNAQLRLTGHEHYMVSYEFNRRMYKIDLVVRSSHMWKQKCPVAEVVTLSKSNIVRASRTYRLQRFYAIVSPTMGIHIIQFKSGLLDSEPKSIRQNDVFVRFSSLWFADRW